MSINALKTPIAQLVLGAAYASSAQEAPAAPAASTASGQPSSTGPSLFDLYPQLNSTSIMKLDPAVRGWTNKSEPTNRYDWMRANEDSRLSSFIDWRVQRGQRQSLQKAYTCDKADHPPLAYPGCHIFINHKYRFIYIRTPKAASTSIVDVLGECGNKNTGAANAPHCMTHSWDVSATPEELEKYWNEYFVFGFVRNPWRRAYSLYKYLQSSSTMAWSLIKDGKIPDHCKLEWGTFCKQPWEETERLHNSQCFVRSRPYLYFHMIDQYRCFRTVTGEWATDFIGSVEHANEDWRTVVQEINKRRMPNMPPVPVGDLEETNVKRSRHSDPYGGENAHCVDAVSQWYACDAQHFGFLPEQQRKQDGQQEQEMQLEQEEAEQEEEQQQLALQGVDGDSSAGVSHRRLRGSIVL